MIIEFKKVVNTLVMQCSESYPTVNITRFGEEFIFIASILESDLNCENSETVEYTRLLHHL